MFTIIFSAVIGLVMVYVRYRENQKENANQDNLDLTNFTKYDFSKTFVILYGIVILIGIASAIYGFVEKQDTTVAMGIIITLLFVSEAIGAKNKYCIYYNEYALSSRGKLIRYRDIKDFEFIKNIGFAWVKVHTYTNETISISRKSYNIIRKLYDQKVKK